MNVVETLQSLRNCLDDVFLAQGREPTGKLRVSFDEVGHVTTVISQLLPSELLQGREGMGESYEIVS